MAQATILAAGTTRANSTNVVIGAGASVKVGVFSNNAAKLNGQFLVKDSTPGADNIIAVLDNQNREVVIQGPGTYLVERESFSGEPFGVFQET